MMPRALVFDFDGLVVDTETAIIDAWEALHREDGLACDRGVLHRLVGSVDVVADIWTAYPATQDRVGLDARHRAAARVLTLARPVLPGVRELIGEARAAGLRIGVASNSSHAHVEGHLAHRGMLGLFDHIACRDDVAAGKPAPDVYLAALAGLGVAADEAVAFEDSSLGHLAAHRAGLRVMVVPNPSTAHDVFPHASWRRESLAGLTLAGLRALAGGGGAG
ncbi:MAG: HAD-IA family hydrolase [Verrucomicrobiota bacterium]